MTTEITTQDQAQSPANVERTSSREVIRPAVEINDSETEILLTAEMPGVDEGHADVTLERNVLTVSGTAAPVQPEGFELVYSECLVADYERSFTLSDKIDRDGIEATVKNGVLILRLPKVKEAQVKKIGIKAG
jgi:HSP20 family molecular chaperone IbpA